jgi:predicted Zn-dependent protease
LKHRFQEEADRLAKPAADELFLANYLAGQAGGALEANEVLGLLDRLRPVYARQPAHVLTLKHWTGLRASYLMSAGQTDAALRLQKQLATDYPNDLAAQQNYANALVNAGDYEAAYAWLRGQLTKDARWLPGEEAAIRGQHADFLERQGHYADLAEHLAEWAKRDPDTDRPYAQYLSALLRTEQEERANALIERWLREGQTEAEPSPAVASRLSAAVGQALGQGYNLYTNRIEERWLTPLADAALYIARHGTSLGAADRILGHGPFTQTDECRRVRKAVAALLTAEIDRRPPELLGHYVSWVLPDDPALGKEAWKQIADGLRARWATERDPQRKHQLGQTLVQVLRQRAEAGELIAFLHRQHSDGPEAYRAAYAHELFQTLVAQPWSAEYEDEALALLGKLSDAEEPAVRLAAQVEALYRFTDRMLAGRTDARMKAVEHPEKLTRTELAAKKAEALRLAREGLGDRLRKELPKAPTGLAPWLTAERLYLEALSGRNLPQAATECWDFLGAAPKPASDAEGNDVRARLDDVLRERYVMTLANLATRKGADAALVERLLKYFDAGIAADPRGDRWQLHKVRLLIALDRPKDLEAALRAWVKVDDPDNRWRLMLGYLLAEQGKVPEAIALFEAVEKDDELGPAAYRTLADWYLAANRREPHERALRAAYRTLEEWQMSQWLYQKLRPWQRGDGHMPTELDEEVLRLFAALFEKSGAPQNYLWQLQQFYQASRDFRLLACLADAVVGHSAEQVYPFLQGMQAILTEVRDEATADELCAPIAKARARARSPVDARALDLLEVLVQRRAAELKNQPGPHATAALAALKRAFQREWAPGEPRLMGGLLAGLGAISDPDLAKEQLRQLAALHRDAAGGSFDRLDLARSYAAALGGYGRTAEAIDLLLVGLREFQTASDGVMPVSANSAVGALVSFLEGSGQHARGEQYLRDQLQRPAHREQGFWLTQRLYQLHHHALQTGGSDSLGSGPTLFKALERQLLADLGTNNSNHRYQLIMQLCAVYRTAHEKKLPGVREGLKAFAFEQFPNALVRQTTNYESAVRQVAQTVHDLAGPREGVAFLVTCIEGEPTWLRYGGYQGGWGQNAYLLAQWREEAKEVGDVEGRLLRLVTRELRRDLETRQHVYRVIYHRQGGYYWEQKQADFAQTAEEVLARHKDSGAACQYVADYFYWGLNRPGRAIEVLADAHARKLLDEGGQARLVDFLHREGRYGESIDLLRPLVAERPENLQYRLWLMSAYLHTRRANDLAALLKQTDAFFHKKDRWNEGVMAGLAQSCLDNRLFDEAVAYYKEVISLHQRTAPRRGSGDGTLSSYYTGLARSYAGLKRTPEAVDAAGGAVVSWGADRRNRTQALETLKQVLQESPDLGAFVAHLDRQTAETGLVNPVVRKAVGQVYVAKQDYKAAAAQLRQALEAQPNDAETQTLLLTCYDKMGDKEGAATQLLEALQLSRHDIKGYQDLGRRLAELDRAAEAERAYTSIVEVLPNEAEGHALLAEVRQGQNRWDEAAAHWEQVARLRALEPTGLLKLAAAQIHLRQLGRATQTLQKVSSRSWPARFGDVPGQVRALQEAIERGTKPAPGR